MRLASPEACDNARDLAAELISPHVALAITLRRAQARTRSAIFVLGPDEAISGVVAILPLNPAGLEAIQSHAFDPKNPPDELLCAPGEAIAGLYGWGFVGSTRRASAVVLDGAIRLRNHLKAIPFFTRAATAAGDKVLRGRMGYAPYPAAPDNLLWNPPRSVIEERAA